MKENKMGTMPVVKLLVSMSLPIVISMAVQALYNVVDTYFISMVSQTGITALGYAFPVQNVMIAVATGIGVGMNAIVSRTLGEKNPQKAGKMAMQGIFLALCSFLVFLVVGLFGSKPFMLLMVRNLNASAAVKSEISTLGTEYLQIVCCMSIGLFLQVSFERILQSTGKTIYTMISQGSGAVINIVLDYIFVLGKCGLPKMGVRGAAVATVIGQCAAAVIGVIFNLTKNTDFKLKFKNIRPDGTVIKDILYIGIPSVLMVAIGSVMNFLLNKFILNSYGADPITVFAYYFKLQSFVFMPIFGLNNGMVPILGYNYGAGHKKRLYGAIKAAYVFALGMMMLGLVCFQVFPDKILSVFSVTQGIMKVGVPALRIISVSYIFAGICVVSGSVCQALGKSMYSFWVAFGRQLVVLIPTAWALSEIFHNIDAVWWSFPIAEIVSLILSLIFVRRVLKNLDWDRVNRARENNEKIGEGE